MARSVGVSLAATLVAACFALPGALWIVYGRSRQRTVLLGVFNVGLGLPPVAVGLAVAFTFWRSGPLGSLDLLYTPVAMIVAQTLIITPLMGTLPVVALRALDPSLNDQLTALTVPTRSRLWLLVREYLAESRCTLLLATQNLIDVTTLCKKAMVFEKWTTR